MIIRSATAVAAKAGLRWFYRRIISTLGSDDTILAAVSRSTHRAGPTQYFIDIGTAEGAATGLRQNSMIQCENLLTYDQQLILRAIGRLSPAMIQPINECLRKALDL